MPPYGVHYELLLPGPLPPEAPPPAKRTPIELGFADPVWLEVVWAPERPVRYLLGSSGPDATQAAFSVIREAYPGLELGPVALRCPFYAFIPPGSGTLLRAIPAAGSHYWPIQMTGGIDRAGILLRSLAPAIAAEPGAAVLQFVFERVPTWEHRPFGTTFDTFVQQADHAQRGVLLRRAGDAVYHLEIRLAVTGRDAVWIAAHANQWLSSWSSWNGGMWREFRPVPGTGIHHRALEWAFGPYRDRLGIPARRQRFCSALVQHDLRKFAAPRAKRDVSGRELANILPVPWRERHPGLIYAGAPAGSPGAELVVPPRGVRRLALPPGLSAGPGAASLGSQGSALGTTNGTPVRLPQGWHHLAILGRTRSGKSTAAQNVALDILRTEPNAHVVVLEPTGNLIRDLVERIPGDVARDTVAIDPSRPTFTRDGVEMAAVPLNLLQMPTSNEAAPVERERQAERLSGDLVQAIKNAWGEESIGGRADFILRAVLQGLSGLEGATLVDAYAALSDKNAMKRLERLATGDSLRSTLKVHLPKLDYSMTISSLDKVGKIATNPLFRKSLCQRAGPVPFERLLQHRLLLLNLGKGPLGTEGAGFLGAIFLTRLWSAVQERPRSQDPIYLVVDEFHNYAIPPFADMLSEGARLGLHVVPITQFLGRVPPKVRSAMVGNVDAWLMFSLGAEDTREAWQIARGEQFGWRPEDLDSGLRPHQAALATRGSLIKVDMRAPLPPSAAAAALASQVEESSRRYARPEDSGGSPLSLSQEQLVRFLDALDSDRPKTRTEVGSALGWRPEMVSAAASLCLSEGNAADDPGTGLRLLRKGRYLREAIQVARNEGEEHCALLAEAATFLEERGVRPRIVAQGGGYFVPDGEFEIGGRTYSIEVECSTLVSRADQVAKNVAKAASVGRRCLVVVSDREAAERFVHVMGSPPTGTALWGDVGLLCRDPVGGLTPYLHGDRSPWGWLTGDLEDESARPAPTVAVAGPVSAHGTGLGRALVLAHQLLAKGRAADVTIEEFAGVGEPGEWLLEDPRRLGMALRSLGVPSRRARRGGVLSRLYDLRALATAADADTPVTDTGSAAERTEKESPAPP